MEVLVSSGVDENYFRMDAGEIIECLVLLDSSSVSSQTSFNQSFSDYGIYDTDGIKPHEYQQRRAAVMARMESGSIAFFHANYPVDRNADTDYKFRQSDNFLCLTGCNETNSTLILAPYGIHPDSVTDSFLIAQGNTACRQPLWI